MPVSQAEGVLQSEATLDAEKFREAMSHIASAVHIVTTDGPKGGRVGGTVSAACSVSDSPPSILICLNRQSRIHEAVLKNKCFCLNTLSSAHESISDAFAGRDNLDMSARFLKAKWVKLLTGCPALETAQLNVDCDVESVSEVGSHSIIVGNVADIRIAATGSPLLYVRRGYKSLRDEKR